MQKSFLETNICLNQSKLKVLLVFFGGGLGSVLRYVIAKYMNNAETVIPYGTSLVNIFGSLLIGIVLGLSSKNNLLSQSQTLLLATGFCGGFTTFSAFAFENTTFIKNGDYINFAIYVLGSIIVGVLAVFLGLFLVK